MSKIPLERQRELTIEYKGMKLESSYRFDILVANSLIVRHGKPPEGLVCFARSGPARHQLRFRRWQAGLAIGQKGKLLSVSLW